MSLVDALRGARAYDLEQPRFAGAPVWPAHEPGVILNLHRRHERDAAESRTSASAMLVMTEHSGTHIDALCHQAYGGRHARRRRGDRARADLGRLHRARDRHRRADRRPRRAARRRGLRPLPDGYRVTASDLERAASGLELRRGDVVLVRLGSGALWADRAAYLRAGGMTADASRWLAARSPCVVGADNVAFDLPDEHDPDLGSLPGHTILIVQEGIHIIESLYLEELAADGVREFGFVCLPLKLRGGTGSPVRPIALV